VTKREALPDPIFGNAVLSRLVNKVMLDGKKGTAQHICYGALDIVKEKTGKDPMDVFEAALNNVMPLLEVKARRVGGATYQVPLEVRPSRRQTLGLRWLVSFARERSERTMEAKLAAEIVDAANNTGKAVGRKEDIHRMAEANRAFAHYRW
jgi:small subunit ribosomal protein S7